MGGIRINIQNLILSQKLEAQVYFWTNLYAIQFLCSLFKIRNFVPTVCTTNKIEIDNEIWPHLLCY